MYYPSLFIYNLNYYFQNHDEVTRVDFRSVCSLCSLVLANWRLRQASIDRQIHEHYISISDIASDVIRPLRGDSGTLSSIYV